MPPQEQGNQFGQAVDISGGDILISAPNGPFCCSDAFVYSLTGPGTNVTAQRVANIGAGLLRFSVAIEGDRAVIGMPFNESHFAQWGEVDFLMRSGGSWVGQASVIKTNTNLGWKVALSGDTVAATKPCLSVLDPSNCSPSVLVFVQSGTNWIQQAELPASNSYADAIALSGNTLLIGPAIYVRSGTTWQLLPQTLSGPTNFASEAIDGNIAVIGTGTSVYIFQNIGGSWTFQQQVFPSDATPAFGRSIDIKGTRIVIGADEAAYVFDRVGGTWVQLQKLLPITTDLIIPHDFGASVAISDRAVIVGAPLTDILGPGGSIGNAAVGVVYMFTSTAVPVSITSGSASPSVLWPPNHKLVPVTLTVNTTGSPSTCKIVSVTSNQPINGTGDGNTSPDWVITGDLTLLLRAERAGNIKTDRVYTITVECADSFGNTARANVFVTVPHDQGNK